MKIIQCTAIIEGKKSKAETVLYFKDKHFTGNNIFGQRRSARELSEDEAKEILKDCKERHHSIRPKIRTESGLFSSSKTISYKFKILEV